ncbi:MAG TPA: cation acetate symporter, partial [Jiangellales bacterium]|nr:cation acetate symporter [Jiangellales bacterium]
RLESLPVRRGASVLVVLIGWLYLLPQFQAAGLTLRTVTGAPAWAGAALVAVVVLVSVLSGGMRSITFVQAFQYWLKLTALAVPVVFLLSAWQADGAPAVRGDEVPAFEETTRVEVTLDVAVDVVEPLTVTAEGTVGGEPVSGPLALEPGSYDVAEGTVLTFPAGAPVPHVERLTPVTGDAWALPLEGGRDYALYSTYSLVLALFFGTMGLPHVLVRFYTNPDGRAARRTTLVVLVLLGLFYLWPTVYGVLGRVYAPDLLLTGRTDAVVLVLPGRMVEGLGGELLGALVTAGAFAAFLSTSSGLTVSVAGVLTQDLLRPWARASAASVRAFRVATVIAVLVPFGLALLGQQLGIADVVGLAFAVAASSFCPLLLLGIWWRRLTDVGALAGLAAGGGLATAAVLVTIVAGPIDGLTGALLAQPAAWTLPAAFLVMVVVSLATPRRVAPGVTRTMVRLHAPEVLDVDRGDWHPERRTRR